MDSEPLSIPIVPCFSCHSRWRRVRITCSGGKEVLFVAQALAVDVVEHVQQWALAAITQPIDREPKFRVAKSSNLRALARASIRIGALVPRALQRALRLCTANPSSR